MRILDLFSCAGGGALGYARAGLSPFGVDIEAQPRYPFPFYQDDAIGFVDSLIYNDQNPAFQTLGLKLSDFDAIHASPPCQAHSVLQKQSKRTYIDLIPDTREVLERSGLPYVIENVEGSTLRNPVTLCGTMFPGLRVIRHRLFETNWPLEAPKHRRHPLVFTHDKRKRHYGKLDQDTAFVQVTGGGNATVANKLDAMGIDWMTGYEVNEAIPPAYTEHIGRQLLAHITSDAYTLARGA